jgi:hypothetical protein
MFDALLRTLEPQNYNATRLLRIGRHNPQYCCYLCCSMTLCGYESLTVATVSLTAVTSLFLLADAIIHDLDVKPAASWPHGTHGLNINALKL